MSFTKKLGRDLSTGTPAGVQTALGKRTGDTNTVVVTVEGPVAALEALVPAQGATHDTCAYVPTGCYVQTATLSTDGRGGAKLTINCADPGADSASGSGSPTKVTYRIEMAEEKTDLIAHPDITANIDDVDVCMKWVATDDSQKYDSAADAFYYDVGGGALEQVDSQAAVKFCKAWMHGIKTYNRYFPIVEKESTYRKPPGLTFNGAVVSGGSPTFSADIGTWDAPGITLSGFASTGWFKSRDSWVQTANNAWTRREQWVWTPDGSSSEYGWIYQASNNS